MEHGQVINKLKNRNPRLPEFDVKKPDELTYDESFDSYLGDKTCVSSSGLKKILESPLHFLWQQTEPESSEDELEPAHFRIGRAAHMMVMEPAKFRDMHIVVPEFTGYTKDGRESPNSKEAKDKKKAWLDKLPPGALFLTQKELEDLTGMVESLMSHPQASAFFKNGKPEVTGRFTHRPTGIRCRIRPDYISYTPDGGLYIFDIKTTRMDNKALFASDAAKRRYHLQLAFYRYGMAQIIGKQPEAVALVAMEKTAPYSTWVYWLTDDDLDVGMAWNEEALRNLKRSLTTGKWPGPQSSGEMLELPTWARTEALPQFNWE